MILLFKQSFFKNIIIKIIRLPNVINVVDIVFNI